MIDINHDKRFNHLLLLIVLTCGACILAQAQITTLPMTWKLNIGDNPAWAAPEFNDSSWKSTTVGTSWSPTGHNDTVFAWYRVRIFISSAMKNAIDKANGMELRLGKIDDVDQTFLNAKNIGQTGSFPPVYETQYDVDRTYIIPPEDIRYDTDNVIAVRVFSHIGGVGMYEGPYAYGPIEWHDVVQINQTVAALAKNSFSSTLTFTNNGKNVYKGTLEYLITGKSGNAMHNETVEIQIAPGSGKQNVFTFGPYEPKKEDFVRIGYRFTEHESNVSVHSERMFLANRKIEIKVSGEPKPVVQYTIPAVYASLPFKDQQLQGYLGERLRQNLEKRLLDIEEQELLAPYLQRPGNQPWIGEHIGKYLETASNVWKYTQDVRLKKQMDRMMYTLINTQLEDGYLGTYAPDKYWTSWDVWAHKYNLYGLLGYYTATGYPPALETCKRIGDMLCKTFGTNPGQHDILLAGEHIGMAATSVLDPMAELYRYTGNKKYLDFCQYIIDAYEQNNGPKIISSLLHTGQVNKVANGKAYEMLSNIVGLVKLYRVTGDETLLKAALLAWQDVITNRLYITGTTSSREYFKDDGLLPGANSDNVGEGCVTVTWMQLNHMLLAVTGESRFAEQIEKTIYNHLLAAENPRNGCVSYYTPLIGKKPFVKSVSCCQSSVPRGIAMIPYFAFGNVHDTPTLMMYEPASYKATVTTADRKKITLSVRVLGTFPESGEVSLRISIAHAASFPIALRVPSWCTSFVAHVNGKTYTGNPHQYLTIARTWKSNDRIQISFDMPVQSLSGGISYPGHIAFQRGPQVLSYDSSLNTELLIDSTAQRLSVSKAEFNDRPDLLPKEWIGTQSYSVLVKGTGTDSLKKEIVLVPYADASQTGGAVQVWLPFNGGR